MNVDYYLNEREQYLISKIDLDKLPPNHIKDLLVNKEGYPINILSLESDLQVIVRELQRQGYYFTSIKNINDSSILKYDKANQRVSIHPDIDLGSKICFNELIVAGTRLTKNLVVSRELTLKKGEIITPDSIEELNQKLAGLGLFATHRVTPYIIYGEVENSCVKTNLLVQVKEKEFGVGEIASIS